MCHARSGFGSKACAKGRDGICADIFIATRAFVGHERLAGRDARYLGSVNATNLKVSGVHVFSAGDFLGAPGTESIVFSDQGLGTYRKLVIAGGCLVGAVLYGDTADSLWYLDLIRSGTAIDSFREDLIFGRALAERQAA